MDDVIIVSGHNIGTAEVESALVGWPEVSEAAAGVEAGRGAFRSRSRLSFSAGNPSPTPLGLLTTAWPA